MVAVCVAHYSLKNTCMKYMRFIQINGHRSEWNRIKSPEINWHISITLFHKWIFYNSLEKGHLLTNVVEKTGFPQTELWKYTPTLHPIQKLNQFLSRI